MGFFVYPLLTLILTQKIGMSIGDAGLYVSFVTLTQAPCLILGGKLADRIGRRRLAVTAGLMSGLFYLICGFTGAGHSLIWFLMIAADFDVIAMPAWEALLADHTQEHERQPAYSLMYLGTNIGMTISPIVAGLLFNDFLYLVFILDACTTILCNLIVWRKVPESHPHRTPDETATPAAAGGSLLDVLRKVPVLVAFVFLLFVFDFCYIQWEFTLPAECGVLFGSMGAPYYSILTSENALTVILFTPLLTNLARKLHPLVAVGIGGILYTIAYVGLGFSSVLPAFLVFGMLFTLGEVMCAIQTGAYIASHSPREFRGRISAFANLVRGSSQAMSPSIMGAVLGATSYTFSWLVGAVLVAGAAVGMFALSRKEKRTRSLGS